MTFFPKNDCSCGWLTTLDDRTANSSLNHDLKTKWLIIGAGYSGLSAALMLAKSLPNEEIILVDACRAGEGSSARNSGFLVDINRFGHKFNNDKYSLNQNAIKKVKDIITKNKILCGWNECGKYYATSRESLFRKLQKFSDTLNDLNIKNKIIIDQHLHKLLGTSFYTMAVKTEGGIMLQPAALARGMINALPNNVTLFENTPVIGIQHAHTHIVRTKNAEIKTNNLIVAINGFMPSLNIKNNRVFPLLLSASLTRKLSVSEQAMLYNIKEFGLLSAHRMGATLRYTADHRLMIRNTIEVSNQLTLSKKSLNERAKIHLTALLKRYPFLPKNIIDKTWSGVTCISSNNANIFETIGTNYWQIGCYNGAGIGLAVLFGEQIVKVALKQEDDVTELIKRQPKAQWLPPQPLLNWIIKLKLVKDRIYARKECDKL